VRSLFELARKKEGASLLGPPVRDFGRRDSPSRGRGNRTQPQNNDSMAHQLLPSPRLRRLGVGFSTSDKITQRPTKEPKQPTIHI